MYHISMKSISYLLLVNPLLFLSRLTLISFVFFSGLGNVLFSKLQAMNQGHTTLKIDTHQVFQLIRSRRLAATGVTTIELCSIGIVRRQLQWAPLEIQLHLCSTLIMFSIDWNQQKNIPLSVITWLQLNALFENLSEDIKFQWVYCNMLWLNV